MRRSARGNRPLARAPVAATRLAIATTSNSEPFVRVAMGSEAKLRRPIVQVDGRSESDGEGERRTDDRRRRGKRAHGFDFEEKARSYRRREEHTEAAAREPRSPRGPHV